ncbi:hypothetical protein ACSSS7_003093 [Eimeria intestinalis]
MAWRSHGRTNAELVQNLRRNGVFRDQRVYETMLKVDRGFFVRTDPYADSPQPIGFDATISAPHMHAVALEEMAEKLVFGSRALDVGSGTGYLTLIVGNGWAGGPSVGAPYDAIHVGAAAQAVPEALLRQLAPGGVMVIPVECRKGRIAIEGEGDRQLPGDPYGWGQVLVAIKKQADGKLDVKYVTSVMCIISQRCMHISCLLLPEKLPITLHLGLCFYLMRKKVDPRVRGLVESCIATHERSFIVLVGDRGREQVVNLHFLLAKLTSSKPSVLWCYKKELGFSSHRRKRQKQLQKKISRGVYDPNLDDPFELFVSSTEIRYVYYKETQQVLGQTFGMCVLQDYEALTPNVLCRAVETVRGGGIVCLLLHSFSSLQQLYSLTMDIHARYRTEAFSRIHPRYNERFLLSLVSCSRCLILDDELNVLPINSGGFFTSQQGGSRSELLQQQQQQEQQQLQQIKDKVQHAPPLDALVKLCVTKDQANAVLAFLDCLCSCRSFRSRGVGDSGALRGPPSGASPASGAPPKVHEGYQTVALTAGRGRGKSAALGLAVAAAVALDVSSIFICAPNAENVQTLFEFIQKGFVAMGYREQADFQVTMETLGIGSRGPTGTDVSGATSSGLYQRQAVKAITQIEVYRHHRQIIKFIFPHEKDALMQAELLVVDEAASIPLPVVKKLLGPYVVLLSSTINGYEGTGRSLSLKLLGDLRRGAKASPRGQKEETGGAAARRHLKELSLNTPIRYAAGDAVEAWLHELLCLDATNAPQLDPEVSETKMVDNKILSPLSLSSCLSLFFLSVPLCCLSSSAKIIGIPAVSSCSLYLVNRDALFSYHPASEAFLQRLQSLFVSSHYKNTPNDLQLLADAPAHLVFAFMKTVDDNADSIPDVYCAIQVAIEGALSRGAIREALGRGLRPAGDLLPWTLAQAFADEDVGLLTGVRRATHYTFIIVLSIARIVRIAVHPSLQRMGFGSAALQQLIDFFEGKDLALQEPPEFAAFTLQNAKQQQQQQQDGARKKERFSKLDQDIEDLDAEAGMSDSDEEGDAQGDTEETEGAEEREAGEEESEASESEAADRTVKRKKRERLKHSKKGDSASNAADAAAAAAVVGASLREVKAEQLRPRATPPLLCPCSRSRPPFSLDYMGASFGLTEQLLRFWSRRGFVPVYLRQQPSDVTGEHSCIMLRPAAAAAPAAALAAAAAGGGGDTRSRGLYGGIDADMDPETVRETVLPCPDCCVSLSVSASAAAPKTRVVDGNWVSTFAEDFRRRFVQLTGGPFRSMPLPLALAIASAGAKAPQGDSGLAPLNAKTVSLFFTLHDLERLRKYAQQLADISLITDLMPLLCCLYFGRRLLPLHLSFLQEAALLGMGGQRRQPASSRRVAIKQGEAVGGAPGQAPLVEEQQADAAEVLRRQKQQIKKISEALGPDALQKYAVDQFDTEDIEQATRGRQVSGSISIKKKHKQPGGSAGEVQSSGGPKATRSKGKKFKNKCF